MRLGNSVFSFRIKPFLSSREKLDETEATISSLEKQLKSENARKEQIQAENLNKPALGGAGGGHQVNQARSSKHSFLPCVCPAVGRVG